MLLRLVFIGEVMAEIRFDKTSMPSVSFAGDTYNTAVYCARSLGTDGAVAYLTRIGRDALSTEFLQVAGRESLDLSRVEQDPDRNIGIYAISTTSDGEHSFDYWRDQSAVRRLFANDQPLPKLAANGVLYFSGITLAILEPAARAHFLSLLQAAKSEQNVLIAFDSNYRPRLWSSKDAAQTAISAAWEIADIALPSIDDEMSLLGDADEAAVISRFRLKDWSACAIKRGARGPVDPHMSPSDHPDFTSAARVVDTTAAGDSFNGGYLAAYLQSRTPTECMLAGHTLVHDVVAHSGAIVAQPPAATWE